MTPVTFHLRHLLAQTILIAIPIDQNPCADLAGALQLNSDVDLPSWHDRTFLFIRCPALVYLVLLQDRILKVETMKEELYKKNSYIVCVAL